MILFYTDLTAKLWALNYDNLAPQKKIDGFRTMSGIKVPRLYWNDFVRLSKTRLWFGLRQESFDVQGKELAFAPTATRVYAASSDPLYPGKETTPNYQSGKFLGWWDDHYSAVADYEPYYYKLNQLQKWGCICMVLKEEKVHSLDFLLNAPVERNLSFETWYAGTPDLKNRTQLPLADKTRYGKTTECLPLLHSQGYTLMGRYYIISGGVTLATQKDIQAKLRKARSTLSSVRKSVESVSRKLAARRTGETKQSSAAGSSVKSSYGTFSARKEQDSVKLLWRKGSQSVLNECVDTLVALQEQKSPGYKDEAIFRSLPGAEQVVRLASWKSYLIKSKDIKDAWIYLRINEPEKTVSYSAKASGTEPYCDIFYARLISAVQAGKLTAQGTAIIY